MNIFTLGNVIYLVQGKTRTGHPGGNQGGKGGDDDADIRSIDDRTADHEICKVWRKQER